MNKYTIKKRLEAANRLHGIWKDLPNWVLEDVLNIKIIKEGSEHEEDLLREVDEVGEDA